MLVYTEIGSISCCSLNMHKHKFLLVIQIMWTVLCLLSEANSSSKKPFLPPSFLMLRLNWALDSFLLSDFSYSVPIPVTPRIFTSALWVVSAFSGFQLCGPHVNRWSSVLQAVISDIYHCGDYQRLVLLKTRLLCTMFTACGTNAELASYRPSCLSSLWKGCVSWWTWG